MVAVAGETRLVTTAARAECFLRGHVADRIVGQRDREGEGKLAAGLQIQAELAEVLRGTGQEHGWPNLHRLHLDLNDRLAGDPGVKEHGLLGEDPCRFVAGSGILFDDLQSFGQMLGRGGRRLIRSSRVSAASGPSGSVPCSIASRTFTASAPTRPPTNRAETSPNCLIC